MGYVADKSQTHHLMAMMTTVSVKQQLHCTFTWCTIIHFQGYLHDDD